MDGLLADIEKLPERQIFGRVQGIQGLLVEINGPVQAMGLGEHVLIHSDRKSVV